MSKPQAEVCEKGLERQLVALVKQQTLRLSMPSLFETMQVCSGHNCKRGLDGRAQGACINGACRYIDSERMQ